MVKLLEVINVFLKVTETVLHGVGVFAVNDGMIRIDLGGHGLVIRGESVRDVVVEGGLYLLLAAELIDDRLDGVHTADEVALGEVEIALVVDGS